MAILHRFTRRKCTHREVTGHRIQTTRSTQNTQPKRKLQMPHLYPLRQETACVSCSPLAATPSCAIARTAGPHVQHRMRPKCATPKAQVPRRPHGSGIDTANACDASVRLPRVVLEEVLARCRFDIPRATILIVGLRAVGLHVGRVLSICGMSHVGWGRPQFPVASELVTR